MSINKLIIFIFLFISVGFSQENVKQVSLQLQWKHQFQFAGYYIAKEKGFYKDAGFDVNIKEFEYGMNVPNEIINNQSTFGTGRPTLLINRSAGDKVVLLASIFQSSPNVFITTNPAIKTIEDFKDKTVMVTGDAKEDATILSMIFSHGLTIDELVRKEHSFNINDLIDKNTDLMSSYISNEPFILDQKGVSYKVFDPKEYGFDFYNDILFTNQEYMKNNYDEVKRFTQASLNGWKYAFDNIEESVDIILKKYNTQGKSKEALIYEAKELKKLAYYKTDALGTIEQKKIEKMFDYYRLMGFITNEIDFNQFIQSFNTSSFLLTQKEQKYLDERKTISMCIDPFWMPFEQLDAEGNHVGMTADYIKIFSELLQTKFKVIKTDSWTQSLEYVKNRKCDILSLAMETEYRKKFLNFTTPYLKTPLVIATKHDVQFINEIEELYGKKVGITQGYAFADILKKQYPDLEIVEVKTVEDGLRELRNKKIFAFIGTLSTIGYQFQTKYAGELKITGKLDLGLDLGMGVRNDEAMLFQILQKAVSNITPEQHRDIANRWVSIKYEKNTDYSLVWKTIAVAILIIIVILYFYMKELKLKQELKKQKDEFETIFRNSKDGIALVDLDTKFLNFNDEYLKMTGLTREELLQESCLSLTREEDLDKTYEMLDEVMRTGYVQNFEKRCKVKDEREVTVNMSISLMPDKETVLLSTKDITQLKQLESQKKLAAMGEMIGNIAHQWRQPLSIISTLASGISLKKEVGVLEDEEFYKACSSIDETSQYLSQTIDDFTKYIKGESRLVKFDLKNDTDSFIKLVDSSIKNYNIQVILNLEEHIEIQGYPNELIQCFINIFNNAKDALVANNVPDNERYIIISQYVKENKVYIEFKDNAGGIPNDIIDKIFQPYFTTKHESQGTGLGLHMTYNLISNQMGGEIEVENIEFDCNKKSYKGALFRIILPLE